MAKTHSLAVTMPIPTAFCFHRSVIASRSCDAAIQGPARTVPTALDCERLVRRETGKE